MITRPTSEQLVSAARRELTEKVRPSVQDPAILESLGMMESLLAMVERRVDHEAAWMREEIDAIETAAVDTVNTDDLDGRVAEALSGLRSERSPEGDTDMNALRREYSAAGEVLSRCIEAAMPVGGERQEKVEDLLRARLHREVAIRGEFSLVGRD